MLRVPQTEFLKSFEIAVQPARSCGVAVSWKRLLLDRKIFLRVAAAFIRPRSSASSSIRPVKTHLLGNASVVVWALGDRRRRAHRFREAFQSSRRRRKAISPP